MDAKQFAQRLVNFRFTRIVIIQSLEGNEFASGESLAEYLRSMVQDTGLDISVDLLKCDSASEFVSLINQLTTSAREGGEIPILHVETHGDPNTGLEFANGSDLSWEQLSKALLDLNIACGFNLLSIFAACFGFYFLRQVSPIWPAPCYAIIAPTDKLDPGEIYGPLLRFYTRFLKELDVGRASPILTDEKPSRGEWFARTAERWFERVLFDYAMVHTAKEVMEKRVKNMRIETLRANKPQSVGALKRKLVQANRKALYGGAFNTFFSVAAIPINEVRFAECKRRVEKKIDKLRGTKTHLI